MCASPLGSVDGYALQIDELKGTKPTEKIDLSNKELGVASAIIIASCIKENGVLKELKCAPARVFAFLSAPIDTATPHLGSLDNNHLCGLDDDGEGEYTTEGITKLCEGLKESAVTSLRCAVGPSVRLSVNAP